MTETEHEDEHEYVFDVLRKLLGTHKFHKKVKESQHFHNVRLYIENAMTISGARGSSAFIPAGTELVVYRKPPPYEESVSVSVACFHYPGKDRQTVVYGNGVLKTMELRKGSTQQSLRFHISLY